MAILNKDLQNKNNDQVYEHVCSFLKKNLVLSIDNTRYWVRAANNEQIVLYNEDNQQEVAMNRFTFSNAIDFTRGKQIDPQDFQNSGLITDTKFPLFSLMQDSRVLV